jgi:uridine phosphorylase
MRGGYKYHLGFSDKDLGTDPVRYALISGDPDRTRRIAAGSIGLKTEKILSEKRGLVSFLASLSSGRRIVLATSGMGAPSMSIVANELFDVGIRAMIRVGTTGSIQDDIVSGSIVISRAALTMQGAADDIAPREYPASANPFLASTLVDAAHELGITWHLGVTASVDTFYEGQERVVTSSNKHLLRRLQGITEEYRNLGIINYEMETGTLFKMAGVYGFAAGCVCAVISDRVSGEEIDLTLKEQAESDAVRTALRALEGFDERYLDTAYLR